MQIFLAFLLFNLSLIISAPSHAVLDRFNVGVGYGGTNELIISTDSPGEFDYRLYLRTANNTESFFKVHYNGVNNFARSLHLTCTTDEVNATDNPATGTCVSGGPFVRGAFIAGTSGGYAAVKRFTLFCDSVQVLGEESTTNWNTDFDNSAIKNFLDNGASSTWCPTPAPVINKTFISPTNKQSPTKSPIPTISKEEVSSSTDTVPTPDVITTASNQTTSDEDSKFPNLLLLDLFIAVVAISGVAYVKREAVVSLISRVLNKPHPLPLEDPPIEGEEIKQ